MKKALAILMILALCLGLMAGCGGSEPETGTTKKGAQTVEEPAEKPEAEAEPAVEPEAEPEAVFEPVYATIGGYDIAVVGAELFTDTDDKDAIRIYWDFTNSSDETIYPYCDLSVQMEQEGFELNTTYAFYEDDVPEYGNDVLDIRPGVSIRCISEYSCKAQGDIISFTLSNWYDEDDAVTVEFDPKNLPGRPEPELEIEAVPDPAWTEGMEQEGYIGDSAYVQIDAAEVVPGWEDGTEVIRVYFEFTNQSEEACSMWWASYYRAFQDGVELEETWADEEVAEDENMSVDVEPGESIYGSNCWLLRSDSPVEIEVYDYYTEEDCIGCVFVVE